ncbi:ArsR/SmtB family transcription factor [Lysinibacillus pakistanensis]|uniref:Metalloregulator ArsR/SmtB family transcription factor n=1 Tax=Lysinibacillus pakistanensis TaxID=759811 RepID=A0AAX3WZT6_9BACI|nr:metalloregulator ArsR/SmtB family transcription factor [Lysinibacillus pakistanensis]MDM5231424.1 metalloregulator ArsR/SmtB family transcription factor [Lysinibacillus pakistanensis]QGG49735.1 metalloregulator ArsR/SmtB family transcription factor [Lysinibacillus pakistanensis]WHY46972.1 metalloregulator ArsR/SmtB family transcription factor [Lysinibacillus pakistanensis]WHY51985.1 metalloregulator ArsR/SmtB family transcription factor [Lysinibacillus pakistanensis]
MTQPAVKYDVFQAIADPTRRHILQLLALRNKPISLIAENFAISRTAVVKHLTILEQAELVSAQKKGREKIYTLHVEKLKELEDWLQYFDLFWDNKLAQLQNMVEEQ